MLSEAERYQDIELTLEVELDRRRMTIRDLFGLNAGKIIPLSRYIGEELPVYVGGALIGRGEAIPLNQNMGVRITALTEQ